jgi:peptidoglycan/LPS O-acetylase OafA/YrhL
VISGFVITLKLLKEKISTGEINLKRFYLGRFFRLFPALLIMIIFTIVCSALILSPIITQQNVAKNGLASILSIGNVMISHTTGGYFEAPAITNPLLHTWSLAVEEQIYIFLPIFLILVYKCWRFRNFLKAPELIPLFLLTLTSFSFLILFSNDFLMGAFGFYSPIVRAWEFSLGAIMAVLNLRFESRNFVFHKVVATISFIVVLLSPFFIIVSADFPNESLFFPILATGYLLLVDQDTRISRILSVAPLQWIGRYSYSIYLWHWPFIVFATFMFPSNVLMKVVFAILSLALAVLSFNRVERPLRYHQNSGSIFFISLLFCFAVLSSLLLYFSAQNGFWDKGVKSFQSTVGPIHIARESGCFEDKAFEQKGLYKCTWNAENKGLPIYLVGDSNADQFSEGVISAGDAIGSPVSISSASACPFLGGSLFSRSSTDSKNAICQKFNDENIEFLSTAPSGIVVIANIDSYFYPSADGIFGISREKDDFAFFGIAKIEIFKEVVLKTITSLKDSGHRVLLVQTIPNWVGTNNWNPYLCSAFQIIKSGCEVMMLRSEALERQGQVRNFYDFLQIKHGVEILDSWDRLCPGRICSTHPDGSLAYKDGSHISVLESYHFQSLFKFAFMKNLNVG